MSEQVLTQILEQLQMLHKGQEQTHQRLDKVDARLERVEDRLDRVELRLDQLDARLGQVEVRLDKVEGKLGHVETRLNKVEVQLIQLDSRLSQVEALAADIPLIRRAVLETNEDVKRFELHLQKNDSDIGNHEYSIKIIHYDQLKLHTEIEKLKNR
ncbi:MAG: synthase family protein [Paenibacillaceae bacterium]|jgi:chromosome segregation ATPase|nr:synthase family protein [Paenibacillaceae bacterium]